MTPCLWPCRRHLDTTFKTKLKCHFESWLYLIIRRRHGYHISYVRILNFFGDTYSTRRRRLKHEAIACTAFCKWREYALQARPASQTSLRGRAGHYYQCTNHLLQSVATILFPKTLSILIASDFIYFSVRYRTIRSERGTIAATAPLSSLQRVLALRLKKKELDQGLICQNRWHPATYDHKSNTSQIVARAYRSSVHAKSVDSTKL